MHRSVPCFLVIQMLVSGYLGSAVAGYSPKCRTQPGDPSFPDKQQWSQLNSSINGRLVAVVPSAQFCNARPGGCTDAEWASSAFRRDVPGAMLETNWEQDYSSHPPSLCFRNSTTCGQGSVPVYAVNATSAAHIQAGVRFAQAHSLRVAIKASGHDLLGRSTAKGSLLLWTRYLDNLTFHDSFRVGGVDKGSAVTAGSGVGLHILYQACKAQGKVFVGGAASTVVAAGGYVQGAGHSPLGPLLGLGADNVLEFQVVVANGDFVTANEVTNTDLFWALRGGGAGSWGVVISATFRTFQTFDVVGHQALITVNSTAEAGRLVTLHAHHIFDWDKLRPSQYMSVNSQAPKPTFVMSTETFFSNTSIEAANASFIPFLKAVAEQGYSFSVDVGMLSADDFSGSEDLGAVNLIFGSRLVSSDVYRNNPAAVGDAFQKLLDAKISAVTSLLVAGGKVSENAHIDSAVHPKWRTAKTHVVTGTSWNDSTPPEEVEVIRRDFTQNKVPILQELAGPGSASYSNEADVREPHFQSTFFGNYARLSSIKRAYDPHDLFIVGAGVGSERWDAEGLCRTG